MGDAGLLVPLMVAMVALNGIYATAAFGLAGGPSYIGTALAFRVPVPVQPLKAFAAAAVALGLDAEVIAAGALLMSAVMAVLAVTGLASWLAARFPLVLVRGIQAAVALLLVKAAVDLAGKGNWEGLPQIAPALAFPLTAGVACTVLSPLALVVGSCRAASPFSAAASRSDWPSVGSRTWVFPRPARVVESCSRTGSAFGEALTALVLAQLPLTFGNSIVATADAERTYYGERFGGVTPPSRRIDRHLERPRGRVHGGLPVCHGAGGVTAHYKLGARTAVATASAGALLLALALLLGDSLPALLLRARPRSTGRDALSSSRSSTGCWALSIVGAFERAVVALTVGIVTLLAGNLAIGFGVGVALLGVRALGERVGAGRLARA